ncbi:MAG TPA: selenocysteine-specific translation elongation factor, partial [Pirellulaceae bacterium]
MRDLILGTAGHIDHGKTALVRALTGVDTDRLPEEKRRGITIELGFAELSLEDVRLGIVDVPGHERFVRQMLAGATGMDLAMLVVAADDSVKPQTREHMDVLRMLDLTSGVIALTKCDGASREWIELVEQEVRELTTGSFLEKAPLIRTSAVTGQGIEELKDALRHVARSAATRIPEHESDAPFRMAIDRAFSLAGHGMIVTGSVASGVAHVGQVLEILPEGSSARIRGLHHHDRPVEVVHRGQRAAINLAGVSREQLERGHELAAPGYLSSSQLLSVTVSLLDTAPRPLRDRSRVRLHLGTAELPARIKWIES